MLAQMMFVLLVITDRNQELTQQEAGVLQGRGVAVKGRGVAVKGKGVAVKGRGVAVKGRGVAVKGRGVARRQGKRGTTKEDVDWQSDCERRVPVKGRSIGRATRPL